MAVYYASFPSLVAHHPQMASSLSHEQMDLEKIFTFFGDDLWGAVSLNHKQNRRGMAASKGKGSLAQH
jgi:hypothetical protein